MAHDDQHLKTLTKSSKKEGEQRNHFRRLKEYIRLYKQRLYLVSKHQLLDVSSKQEEISGMDYTTFADLRQRRTLTELAQEHQEESDAMLAEIGVQVRKPKQGISQGLTGGGLHRQRAVLSNIEEA
jgi:hypothetical protein